MSSAARMKRLLRDLDDLRKNSIADLAVYVSESNLNEWFFQLSPSDPTKPDCGGRFYGKLVLPPEYPFAPPDYYMLTPNGKFHVLDSKLGASDARICLDNSSFHRENWSPLMSVTHLLLGFNSFYYDDAINERSYGRLHHRPSEIRQLAAFSDLYNQRHFPLLHQRFKGLTTGLVTD